MRRKEERDEHDNPDRWVVSYADFITLLFAFFTTMYAISRVDAGKLDMFTGSMRSALGSSAVASSSGPVIEGIVPVRGDALNAEEEIREVVSSIKEVRDIAVRRDNRGVIISFGDRVLFAAGEAGIKPEAEPALATIATLLKRLPNNISVEGHTDNVPVGPQSKYSSNWELSAARSTSVLTVLLAKHGLSPVRCSAAGYAEFRPIAPNETPEGRMRNRRVDIVVLQAGQSDRGEEKAWRTN